ncbi:2,3-bisphosphoglycerate-dependent phosphoglycerate mutase [Paenibacillus algorifonticola]|uniref:2,3-bisphosphoglycerate-dependent phosphoglycerate mutase n=1 Tax=Paenibacillus algorifonticola TaxID=684063 RepID=A0A1I2CQ27_9BACL|nr:histidine phosphatase family protein [Paenibacillus algorifonticola]SFE70255.1 2,3-bisphosphoglycerate-dependent phosphoglycerate mutase [Paenibacillus algorifonticola]
MNAIYLVRHCQAEGQEPDASLTAAGIEQAQQLASFLANKQIEGIISSPYERAYRTISPLADAIGLPIKMDERLTERILSGQNHPDWREMLRRTYEDMDLCYEGGESSRTATSRAVQVVNEALNSGWKNAVIVSHGNLISLLLKHLDRAVGFQEWEALSNPDVYELSFTDEASSFKRIWKP